MVKSSKISSPETNNKEKTNRHPSKEKPSKQPRINSHTRDDAAANSQTIITPEPTTFASEGDPILRATKPIIDTDLPTSLVIIYATTVNDLEKARIGMNQRINAYVTAHMPPPAEISGLAEGLVTLEKSTIKQLEKAVAAHPLGPWAKRTVGIGNKQLGRLLNATGNPATRSQPSSLWAYCGMHVVDGKAPRRTKGVQGNWSNEARMRVRLIAESCIKHKTSPYRPLYDDGRAKYADVVDGDGKPISDLHKHNRALRLVAKQILLDMWIESGRDA